jgi:hypothetical protein
MGDNVTFRENHFSQKNGAPWRKRTWRVTRKKDSLSPGVPGQDGPPRSLAARRRVLIRGQDNQPVFGLADRVHRQDRAALLADVIQDLP